MKISNFSKINDFLKSESTQIIKFPSINANENPVSAIETPLQGLFSSFLVNTKYLEGDAKQSDCEETTSVCVSFGDEEIFANAIKLSKLEIQ